MKTSSFTDLFIRKPVVAIVINVVILIAGIQAWRSLSVRQYPRSENASVAINTVYVGANAELVRGFVTTPIERAIASANGIDYVESKSLQGFSSITARLKLNYDSTKALADITSNTCCSSAPGGGAIGAAAAAVWPVFMAGVSGDSNSRRETRVAATTTPTAISAITILSNGALL